MIDILESLFLYDKNSPMIFTNGVFWLFFAFALLIYQFIYKQFFWRNLFLFLFSLFFYYKTGGFFFFLIILSTIVDFYIGNAVYRSESKRDKAWLVTLSLVINLGLLAYFKYTYFFTELFNATFETTYKTKDYLSLFANQVFGTDLSVSKILLPVGISFYTFQTISYTIDISRGKLTPTKNIIDFAFYVSFFPQLVAGPIVRAADFVPQIYQKYKLSTEEYARAIYLIINGLVKKILISDYISINFVDRVFENPDRYSGFENLMAIYGYALQIYCDFSGYTDIAIGLALLLGFRLNINFNSPYIATSITDFWRRWHISLSTWLRDYLYIPLGGNRSASVFTYMSVPIMLFIFILVDGWDSLVFAGFGVLLLVWLLFVLSDSNSQLGFLGLVFIISFEVYLFQIEAWYSFVAYIVIFIFWAILLYQPERRTAISTYLNLMITMLLGGLWHGASTRFVIWGALHGLALASHKFWMERTGLTDANQSGFRRFLGQFITFHFVCFCWIYFRAENMGIVNKVLFQIGFSFQAHLIFQIIVGYWVVFSLMLLAFIIHWIPRRFKDSLSDLFVGMPTFTKAVVALIVVIILFQARTSDIQPFIYFIF